MLMKNLLDQDAEFVQKTTAAGRRGDLFPDDQAGFRVVRVLKG